MKFEANQKSETAVILFINKHLSSLIEVTIWKLKFFTNHEAAKLPRCVHYSEQPAWLVLFSGFDIRFARAQTDPVVAVISAFQCM